MISQVFYLVIPKLSQLGFQTVFRVDNPLVKAGHLALGQAEELFVDPVEVAEVGPDALELGITVVQPRVEVGLVLDAVAAVAVLHFGEDLGVVVDLGHQAQHLNNMH